MTTNGEIAEAPLRMSGVSVYAEKAAGEPVPILEEIDFTLRPGEWVNLVGVNGCGKTTLARLLAGLHVEGAYGEMSRGFAGEFASPVVLQRPESQLFGETPREEVVFALEWRETEPERILLESERILQSLGLLDLADRRWEELSGGQKQLAAVAAAIAVKSALLVFDEATSMLDDANRQRILDLARDRHRRGTAIVWVTQRLEEIGPNDRTVALADGRIRFDGDGRSFFYGEGSGVSPCEASGLRLPYLASLALELKRSGRLADPLPLTEKEWDEIVGAPGPKDNRCGNGDRSLTALRMDRVQLGMAGDSPEGTLDGLRLEPGTLTLIMGPNGAGKTAFLEKLAGLRDPEGMSVHYGEDPMWIGKLVLPGLRLNSDALAAYGYAAQSPEHALFHRTLEEEIRYSLRPYRQRSDGTESSAVGQALQAVGWDRSWLPRDPYRMSGGERRRAALAALFATPAPWLLLDEPTAGLDLEGQVQLAEHLVRLKRQGRGIVLVSHDSDWALPLADRVLLLRPDGLMLESRPEELLDHPFLLKQAGMEVPAWMRVANRIRAKGEGLIRSAGNGHESAETQRPVAESAIGSRAPTPHSAFHRLSRFDPRSMWLGYVLLSIGLFSLSSWQGIAAGTAVSIALLAAGRIPLRRWKGLMIAYAAFGLLTAGFAASDFAWSAAHPIRWETDRFTGTLFPFARTMAVLLIGLCLPLVMTPLSLRRALEQLVSRREKSPVFWQRNVLAVTLTVRFVPVLLNEWVRFRRIVLARGKETGRSPRTAVRRLREMSIPLLLALFRLADEVALALESRGVRKEVRPTRGSRLRWRLRDTFLVAGAAVLAGLLRLFDQQF